MSPNLVSWLVWTFIAAAIVYALSYVTGWYAMHWMAWIAAAALGLVLHLWKPMPINTY